MQANQRSNKSASEGYSNLQETTLNMFSSIVTRNSTTPRRHPQTFRYNRSCEHRFTNQNTFVNPVIILKNRTKQNVVSQNKLYQPELRDRFSH